MNLSDFKPVDLDRATVEQLNLVNEKFNGDAPEVWRDIAELNFCALRFCGLFEALTDDELALMSVNLVYQLASGFGGTQPYIPTGERYGKNRRNENILKAFRGNNYRELASKYCLSDKRIRDIIDLQQCANSNASAAK